MRALIKSEGFDAGQSYKDGGKRGHNVANTNVSLFARARNICCGHTKNIIICPQPLSAAWICFVSRSFAHTRNIMSNSSSVTICPRFPQPLVTASKVSLKRVKVAFHIVSLLHL